MLRQNQIGTIATKIITQMPSTKRFICGSAQGVNDPPATEYSIRNPTEATAVSSITIGQFRNSTLRSPVGVS